MADCDGKVYCCCAALAAYTGPTMNAQEFAALLAYSTAMAFTPGPNTTLSSALAANGGLRHAMRFVVAAPLGWSALLLLCSVGLGAAVTAEPTLRAVLVVAGAGAMLWMAWQLARSGEFGEVRRAQLTITFWANWRARSSGGRVPVSGLRSIGGCLGMRKGPSVTHAGPGVKARGVSRTGAA